MYYYIHRAWKRQLFKVVKNKEHQAQIYACLWMLMVEQEKSSFHKNQSTFLISWEKKEPQFVAYYKHEYLPRAGKIDFCLSGPFDR